MKSLQDHFLIAMPAMGDPNFNQTVTYICEHNDHGALGIIINRPIDMQLRDILEQLSLEVADNMAADQPVLGGGPVHQDRGFVLHQSEHSYDSTLAATDDIKVTMSQDILNEVAAGEGPSRILVALGCAGWEAGQLEDELVANAWLSVPADPQIIFDTPFDVRWTAAAALLGVDMTQMSAYAGHAWGPAKQANGIILAFDFGLRRIGVAAGNDVTRSATALTTLYIQGSQLPWEDIDQLLREWSPTLLVVGEPEDMNDTSIARQATDFSNALVQRYGIRVARVDETLTSRAASSELTQARRLGRSKRRVDKAMIDRHAARLIAEQYLNSC